MSVEQGCVRVVHLCEGNKRTPGRAVTATTSLGRIKAGDAYFSYHFKNVMNAFLLSQEENLKKKKKQHKRNKE